MHTSPEQFPPQLEVEPFGEPFCCSCHLQIQVSHVPLFPNHIPVMEAESKTKRFEKCIHLCMLMSWVDLINNILPNNNYSILSIFS